MIEHSHLGILVNALLYRTSTTFYIHCIIKNNEKYNYLISYTMVMKTAILQNIYV